MKEGEFFSGSRERESETPNEAVRNRKFILAREGGPSQVRASQHEKKYCFRSKRESVSFATLNTRSKGETVLCVVLYGKIFIVDQCVSSNYRAKTQIGSYIIKTCNQESASRNDFIEIQVQH